MGEIPTCVLNTRCTTAGEKFATLLRSAIVQRALRSSCIRFIIVMTERAIVLSVAGCGESARVLKESSTQVARPISVGA